MEAEVLITPENVAQAAQVLRDACPGCAPQVGIVLGSGMGEAAAAIEDATIIPYTQVPHMVPSTAPGHKGRFVVGTLAGKRVICMQGRLHAYEGYTSQQIAFPVYIMRELGIQTYVVTNAAGGINTTYGVGDLMLITDHLNFQFRNPCIGLGKEAGPRFFDMTHAYAPELRALALRVAQERGIAVHEGVYVGDLGPSFETPAEIRAFRTLGADAVGMSTVQEVIAANQVGLQVLGISLISNPAAGVLDEPLQMDDVERAAEKAAANMQSLIEGVLAAL